MPEATRDRDREFQEFTATAWPRLLRTAFLLAGDRHTAEDLVQQALERAYAAWGRVRRADDPSAYVRRILFNEHARRFRRRAPEQLVAAVPDRPAGDGYGLLDTRAALLRALGTLPPRQRQAVVLRYWEDLSETQAAAVMGCSVGTVKSQTAKGIAKLRASSTLGDLDSIGATA
ncbi:SigE family RNA polymerase sigma factor [Streptomyces tateyamensis]|uniref:SigE family RNA polymerase sigma factor n=1 Tax=Streptomyces tateyamensis TaxID=565073 RepID=A0A2V4NH63_9ACTN|nr:SigE family RNA polymerase sigma factor [Streptomyces tateyamensis]PYC81366.1 SigE family RNA polymerase sigma factor [Streptomyces tateyamensis]